MADYDVMEQRHPEETTGPHDFQDDPVWGDVWNPTPNTWAPSSEPFPQYGADAGTVKYQDHGDVAQATPLSESYGQEAAGTVPDPRANLLTDVRETGPTPPPPQIVVHEVHTYETGSEIARIRQVQLNGNVASIQPVNILEANPKRKRALVRIIPTDPPQAGQVVNFSGTGGTVTSTVPAGKQWVVQSISFLYTASANVANRNVFVQVNDAAGRVLYKFVDSTALTASQIANVSVAPGNPTQHTLQTGSTFTIQGNLPAGLVLPPGATISVGAIGEDAADTVTLGSINLTSQSVGVGGTASVFIAPRDEGGAASAVVQSWLKLISGDPPIEIKSQSGIDAMVLNSTDLSSLQVYEELIDGNQVLPAPGIV